MKKGGYEGVESSMKMKRSRGGCRKEFGAVGCRKEFGAVGGGY